MEPKLEHYAQPFWEGLLAKTLYYSRCVHCGHAASYGTFSCSFCGQDAFLWQISKGQGTLLSFVTYHRSYEGFDTPYTIGLVELDEGPRLLARIEHNRFSGNETVVARILDQAPWIVFQHESIH
jgi:hypothetical protein